MILKDFAIVPLCLRDERPGPARLVYFNIETTVQVAYFEI